MSLMTFELISFPLIVFNVENSSLYLPSLSFMLFLFFQMKLLTLKNAFKVILSFLHRN